MKTMRRILRNGLAGGGIAFSLAYLLMLQGIVASMAQGTMAAAASGPLTVICTPSGLFVQYPGGGEGPGNDARRWHCTTLCQLASAGTAAVLGSEAGAVSAPLQQFSMLAAAPAGIARPRTPERIAEARAPPFI